MEDKNVKPVAEVAAGTDAEKKAKKAEAAKRFKERKQERAKAIVENSTKLKDILVKKGMFNQLPEDMQKFIDSLITPVSAAVSQNTTFNALFGDDPKVGSKITLGDAFAKTFKGKATLDIYFNRLKKERGIEVEFKQDKDMLKSTYTIIKM